MDLNKVMIIGRLTRDPEVRTIPSGQSVASFGVATNRVWKDQAGQKQEKVEFHNVIAWRKLSEIAGKFLKKASRVFVEGHLETRNWTDQAGAKHYRTEITADNIILLDRFEGGSGSFTPKAASAPEAQNAPPASGPEEEISVEDIPF